MLGIFFLLKTSLCIYRLLLCLLPMSTYQQYVLIWYSVNLVLVSYVVSVLLRNLHVLNKTKPGLKLLIYSMKEYMPFYRSCSLLHVYNKLIQLSNIRSHVFQTTSPSSYSPYSYFQSTNEPSAIFSSTCPRSNSQGYVLNLVWTQLINWRVRDTVSVIQDGQKIWPIYFFWAPWLNFSHQPKIFVGHGGSRRPEPRNHNVERVCQYVGILFW